MIFLFHAFHVPVFQCSYGHSYVILHENLQDGFLELKLVLHGEAKQNTFRCRILENKQHGALKTKMRIDGGAE